MSVNFAYEVKVGKNVASLKGYHNKKPRFKLKHHQKGALTSMTDPKGFEFPFIVIFGGLVLALASYLFYTWDKLPRYATLSLAILLGVAAVATTLYGIGSISAGSGLLIENKEVIYWRRFFWITRRNNLTALGPDYVFCAASLSPQDGSSYILDLCLHFPQPIGMLSVFQLEGYTRIPPEKGAQWKPYETALIEIHERAKQIGAELNLELHPNFSGGPVSDVLRDFFNTEEDDESRKDNEAPAAADAEQKS